MTQAHIELPDTPPIVLMVDDDRDTLDMYSAFFEASGVWVAAATAPAEALDVFDEVRPDLVVTDVGFNGSPLGFEFVDTLKSRDNSRAVPLIVLSGRASEDLPAATRRQADLCLVKPVLPDTLLTSAKTLIARAQALRERSINARARVAELIDRSSRLTARAEEIEQRLEASGRMCPSCSRSLQWIEQGRIGGVAYDYYHWCARGCGLYCYARNARQWVKLA